MSFLKHIPYEYPAYTNPYSFQGTIPDFVKKENLWNGKQASHSNENGYWNIQIFVKEGMHFYRIKWQNPQSVFNIFKKEKEDEEYIDFCISNPSRIKSMIRTKKNQLEINNTRGDLLQIFIKKDLFDISAETLKRKLRVNPSTSKIQQPLKEILQTFPEGNRNALKLESKFLEFTYNYLDYLHQPIDDSPSFLNDYVIQQLEDIQEYLHANFVDPPSIKTIVKKFGINKDYLNIGFKALFQISPHQYIIELKLEKARELLCTTNLPVKTIAAEVGYSNYAHFVNLYVKKFGTMPSGER